MKIEKIQKMNSGKYKLVIDGNDDIVTYDEVILKNNLLYNKELDNESLLKINTDTAYYDIYTKVIKYIQVRLRSRKEIIKYLDKYNLEDNEKIQIMDQLKKVGLINDLNFAKAYIADKMHLSNYGPYKIKEDLEKHDIDSTIIEELIANLDDNDIYDKLYCLMKKKVMGNKKYSKYQLKAKILDEFMRLGYPNEMINNIFDELYVEDNNIIKNEYQKIYNKLKNKYSGNELYFKIKQKLYQKGFNKEEINEVINDNLE